MNILSFFNPTDDNPHLVRPGDRKRLQAGRGVRMELLAWGNTVGTSLMEAAGVLSQGQREVNTRASENRGSDHGYYGYYGGYNNYGREYNRDASRTATQQQKTQSMQQAQQIFERLLGSRNAIRQTMTERYKMEFN